MKIYEIDDPQNLKPGAKKDIGSTKKFFGLMRNSVPVKELTALVVKNCSESITAMRETRTLLYRGLRGHGYPDAFKGAPRNNRVPTSMSRYANSVEFDNALLKAGAKAIRSNSIFCTSSNAFASNYATNGGIYIIFPVNGFNFTWSPTTKDSIEWFQDLEPNYDAIVRDNYTTKDFIAALNSKHEIMISSEYYAFKYSKYGKFFLGLLDEN